MQASLLYHGRQVVTVFLSSYQEWFYSQLAVSRFIDLVTFSSKGLTGFSSPWISCWIFKTDATLLAIQFFLVCICGCCWQCLPLFSFLGFCHDNHSWFWNLVWRYHPTFWGVSIYPVKLMQHLLILILNIRCSYAEDENIDQVDNINTSGFYLLMGTAQVIIGLQNL